jgi:hypothetical protein
MKSFFTIPEKEGLPQLHFVMELHIQNGYCKPASYLSLTTGGFSDTSVPLMEHPTLFLLPSYGTATRPKANLTRNTVETFRWQVRKRMALLGLWFRARSDFVKLASLLIAMLQLT